MGLTLIILGLALYFGVPPMWIIIAGVILVLLGR